ncbi:MAG: hypothetical protein ACTSVZ_13255 [Promethearchaeota archaeon]
MDILTGFIWDILTKYRSKGTIPIVWHRFIFKNFGPSHLEPIRVWFPIFYQSNIKEFTKTRHIFPIRPEIIR